MANNTESKFVVLTTNRSGSTWVMSTLNSISGVAAQGELFLPRPRSTEKRWDSDFAFPRYIEKKPTGFSVRPFRVYSYLDELYSQPGSICFKLMYRQLGLYPEILWYFIRHRIKIVHLVRTNHLDVLLSYEVKAQLGRAHVLVGQSAPENIQVELEPKSLLKQLSRLQQKHDLARKLISWFRLPAIEVAYEDLLADSKNFDLILDFLSIELEDSLPESNLIKIRRGGHRDVLSNYLEVKEVMANSRFAELID